MNASPRLTARRATGPFARLHSVWRDAAALLLALRDPRVGTPSRVLALAALVYALSPIDLLPDGIPILGVADDLLLVPAVLALAARQLPAPVLSQARGKVERLRVPGLPLLGLVGAKMVVLVLLGLVFLGMGWHFLGGHSWR